ncbi:hypothetical protein LEP1GSC008_3500 [Leptospira kirschneri serovar Bulgarica str. Nikolaevo]|uniref:Uncharacterized protein n=1 Tax=Leptospira kirschneri serovar Bulgarica str. Nikolaevo TaxID=1240687 RepID=M6FIM8_9LEPT|nr:hypothetical protein LEP1GSC008_3500 [Leptospira kirschneri serovar Bulgarica str. Nikolaevo]
MKHFPSYMRTREQDVSSFVRKGSGLKPKLTNHSNAFVSVSSFVRKGSGLKQYRLTQTPLQVCVSSFVRKGSGLKLYTSGNRDRCVFRFLPLFAKEAD